MSNGWSAWRFTAGETVPSSGPPGRNVRSVVAWPAVANGVARRLARRPDLADRLVGIAGDFVPARTALGAGFVWDLLTS